MRFLSPTDRKYAQSSTYWQFLDYRPPVNFDRYTLKCDARNSTYIYIYHPLDNRYRFSLSIGNTKYDHVATSTCGLPVPLDVWWTHIYSSPCFWRILRLSGPLRTFTVHYPLLPVIYLHHWGLWTTPLDLQPDITVIVLQPH